MVRLDRYWQDRNPLALALWPLSWVFCVVVGVRALAYRTGMLVSRTAPAPVIVVGNISVGGTGKTPLVVWLARYLAAAGFRPGIVIRGYGGNAREWPQRVTGRSDPRVVGDESVLLARRCGCPVMAGPQRVESARRLVSERGCDLILSDDGLQHYALNRDLEIAVVDGLRRFGNGFCLPAGPLRERRSRLSYVDLVLVNGAPGPGELGMGLRPAEAVSLIDPLFTRPLAQFSGRRVTAVAGIGHPQRFFDMLRGLGMALVERPFPDHHAFEPGDLDRPGTLMMTEKDAVKCEAFARDDWWYVPVEAMPSPAFVHRLDRLTKGWRKDGQETA
jgi:tetraacyldisaccharide 4'-kinase